MLQWLLQKLKSLLFPSLRPPAAQIPQENNLPAEANPQNNDDSLLEHPGLQIVLSVTRRYLHRRGKRYLLSSTPRRPSPNSELGLGLHGIPQTSTNFFRPGELANPINKKISETILSICGDEKGPYVIPMVIDHWTTFKNFKNILARGAFLGNAFLKREKIDFTANCLAPGDIVNLDGNVICFSPGGFVDPKAVAGDDRIRVRVDLSKAKNIGKFNIFFKVTDLCMQNYEVKVQLTDRLVVSFERFAFPNSPLAIFFELDGKKLGVGFKKNQLLFYGDIDGINRYCLLLPFIALEGALKRENQHDSQLAADIYTYLRALTGDELRKILICMSQNMTLYSEFNFNGILKLTPHLIYDIHDVTSNKTYDLSELSLQDYSSTLTAVQEASNLHQPLQQVPMKSEVICKQVGSKKELAQLYATNYLEFKKDVKPLTEKFRNGYVESRAGNRMVPAISYPPFPKSRS